MCGIGLVLTARSSPDGLNSQGSSISNSTSTFDPKIHLNASKFDHEFQRRLCQRGPDYYSHQIRHIASKTNDNNGFTLAMHSAVLHLRGDTLTYQPHVDSNDNILCWNGEIFAMNGQQAPLSDYLSKNDTLFLSERLQLAGHKLTQKGPKDVTDPVINVLQQVCGPFATIWLHSATQRVYFAHDRFGRRSFLYNKGATHCLGNCIAQVAGTKFCSLQFRPSDLSPFVLSNVAIGNNNGGTLKFHELPVDGIFVLDLRHAHLEFHPYTPIIAPTISHVDPPPSISDHFNCHLPCPVVTTELQASAVTLLIALSNAVGIRVRSIPRVSASSVKRRNDSTARVAILFSGGLDSVVLAALTHFHVPAKERIDLLTVCFDEMSHFTSPDRVAATVAHAELSALFPDRSWNLIHVNVARRELIAQQREIQTLMAPCETHMDFNIGAAFWFLARGHGKLTVAAEQTTGEEFKAFNERKLKANRANLMLFNQETTNETSMPCPVNQCTRKQTRPRHGSKPPPLLPRSPSSSTSSTSPFCPSSTYQTSARVLLVGIGADEQLAGYSRHRTTLLHKGEQALRAELQMDFDRLWQRNLGRDDRCLAAHGREARFPYLDETVVATISRFPISSLCDANLPRGIGEKRILRVVAEILGLQSCVGLEKRAIQFGSRVAKVSTTGSNRQTRGTSKFASVD